MGGFMIMPDRGLVRFARSLAKHARRITDEELELLLASEWRARMTAAWLIGLDRRVQFREHLGRLLLESEVVYAGDGYRFALARFAEERDAEILVAYLDHYLPRLDCHYDQDDALGALLHLDSHLSTDHAARFLRPGGLWGRSTMRDRDPAEAKAYIAAKCAFAEHTMAGTIETWLDRRQQFLDQLPRHRST